jgi:hypothetical protein
MVFNTTFKNISVILCWSVLLVDETGENDSRKSLTFYIFIGLGVVVFLAIFQLYRCG